MQEKLDGIQMKVVLTMKLIMHLELISIKFIIKKKILLLFYINNMNVQSILLILFIIFILVKLNNGISSDKNNTENYESSNKLVRNITRGKKNREHFITSS